MRSFRRTAGCLVFAVHVHCGGETAGAPRPLDASFDTVADTGTKLLDDGSSGDGTDAGSPSQQSSCPGLGFGPCPNTDYFIWFGDGMGNGGGGCMALPAGCLAQPTCACLADAGMILAGCSCADQDGSAAVCCN